MADHPRSFRSDPPAAPSDSRARSTGSEAGTSSEVAIDLGIISGLRQLYPESNGAPIDEMVRRFLSNARSHLATIQAAADTGDSRPVEDSAHTLRGSSGTLGAHRLSRLCQQVEAEARERSGKGGVASADLLLALVEEFERVEQAFQAALGPAPKKP